MKKSITAAIALSAVCAFAAGFPLKKGLNTVPVTGQALAVKAVTAAETATVAVKAVSVWQSFETAFDVRAYTNRSFVVVWTNGVTHALSTNVYASLPIEPPARCTAISFATNIVVTATTNSYTRLAAQGVATNDLATVSVSGHVGEAVLTNKFVHGTDDILVTGAADRDSVYVIVK